MISYISGQLLAREIDRIEVLTAGGIGYELQIPLSVFEKLPSVGEVIHLHTYLSVKEDGWQLFGFGSMFERDVFRRILMAKGVGPGLALGMLSTLSADRVVRAIRDKDVSLLVTIPRIGRKKAEQIVLDLADKLDELVGEHEEPEGSGRSRRDSSSAADDAVKALVTLGYSTTESERAVRAALDAGPEGDGRGSRTASAGSAAAGVTRGAGGAGGAAGAGVRPTAEIIRQALAFASGSGKK